MLSHRSSSIRVLGIVAFALSCTAAKAQLVLQQTQSPNDLVQLQLMGPDVVISNVFFNGVSGQQVAPVGQGPSEIGRFNGTNTSLGFGEGLFLCPGVAQVHLPGPNDSLQRAGGGIGYAQGLLTPDLDLSQLSGWPYWHLDNGGNIYNKAVLEFDFIPINDMISFRYVFSSEEYERWACTHFNDVFGMFISGPGISGPFTNDAMNIAFIPGSMSAVCINAVNSGQTSNNANGPWPAGSVWMYCDQTDPNWTANTQYYRYNGGQWPVPQPPDGMPTPQTESPYNTDPYYIQHNGMTVVLTASAAVLIGETYHMRMGVANVSDSKYPSAVFLEGNSFGCSDRFTLTVDEGPNVDLSGAEPVLHESSTDTIFLRFNRWGGFYLDEHLQLSIEGDAVAGVDYLPVFPDSLHFTQLDSAVVVPIVLPVNHGDPQDLTINLITSNGDKVAPYPLIIDHQLTTVVNDAAPPQTQLSLFPNPAQGTLHVILPADMTGRTELHVLDMAGRVVAEQVINASLATIDVGQLPDGLYTVKANAAGKVAVATVSVQR